MRNHQAMLLFRFQKILIKLELQWNNTLVPVSQDQSQKFQKVFAIHRKIRRTPTVPKMRNFPIIEWSNYRDFAVFLSNVGNKKNPFFSTSNSFHRNFLFKSKI